MDKKFKIFVIIAMIGLAALAATGTVVALSVVNSGVEGKNEKSQKANNLTTFSLKDPITANLASENKKSNMVIVSIGLGVDEKSRDFKNFSKQFTANEVVIRDEIIGILRKQTYEMITKSDAQEQLGTQIKDSLNKLLETTVIEEVYFGEFFVK